MIATKLHRVVLSALVIGACSSSKPANVPAPEPARSAAPLQARVAVETVTVRDPDAARKIAQAELKVLERDAQVADLETRLEDARDEVVHAMAKLQTLASRAEAASGMAEADVALRTLKSGPGQSGPDVARVTQLLEKSSAEFNKQNYAGALYLATQARTTANDARGRLSGADRGAPRPGETAFAVPVGLKALSRGNVREGPGTTFKVAFAAEPGLALTGYSYVDEWIRVIDEGGRTGWIFRNLVGRR